MQKETKKKEKRKQESFVKDRTRGGGEGEPITKRSHDF